jgi:hypothetical protein
MYLCAQPIQPKGRQSVVGYPERTLDDMIRCLVVLTANLILALGTCAQDFHNFGFEGAYYSPVGGNPLLVYASQALPGWKAYYGTNRQGTVFWDSPSGGSTCISVLSSSSALEGQFSVLLQGGRYGAPEAVEYMDASISQTGTVPSDAQSLQFKAHPGWRPLTVSLDGISVPFLPLSVEANYTVFAADVSAFAGETVELRFSALSPDPFGPANNWTLDSISFRPESIPEPAVPGLCCMALLILCLKPCAHGHRHARFRS